MVINNLISNRQLPIHVKSSSEFSLNHPGINYITSVAAQLIRFGITPNNNIQT